MMVLDEVLITLTVLSVIVPTYNLVPSGLIAIKFGQFPVPIVPVIVLVAVLMIPILLLRLLTT